MTREHRRSLQRYFRRIVGSLNIPAAKTEWNFFQVSTLCFPSLLPTVA